jgi:hypothetical protein
MMKYKEFKDVKSLCDFVNKTELNVVAIILNPILHKTYELFYE